jgi:hypothetical protein
VGIVLQLLFATVPALLPTCAIISGFVVLRQINFFADRLTTHLTCCKSLGETPESGWAAAKDRDYSAANSNVKAATRLFANDAATVPR